MTKYFVSFDMVDDFGRNVRKQFETIDTIVDETAALAAADALADDLAALTEARILGYYVGQRIIYADSAVADANRDEGLTLVARKTDNYKAVLKVPAPIKSVFNPDGTVNILATEVSNYVDNFRTTGNFTFSDGESVAELLSGRLDK